MNLTYSVSCLHDMTVYFIQVKMAKDCHTLTMNIVAHIMMYKRKKDIFIDNEKGGTLLKKKKQHNKHNKKNIYYNS